MAIDKFAIECVRSIKLMNDATRNALKRLMSKLTLLTGRDVLNMLNPSIDYKETTIIITTSPVRKFGYHNRFEDARSPPEYYMFYIYTIIYLPFHFLRR